MDMDLIPTIGWTLLSLFVAVNYGFMINGLIRKVMARIQGRIGPPLWQPYIDMGKLLFQRNSIMHGYMHWLGPVFRSVGGIGVFVLLPVVFGDARFQGFSAYGDLLLVLYFMFFGSLGMALGAGEGGHPHSPIGVSRGLSQMTAYELPFILAIVAVVAAVGSFQINDIVAVQQGGWQNWFLFSNPFATVAAFIAILGMNMYAPFNIVGAPTEIPVGPPTEYQNTYFSLMMIGRAAFGIAKMVLYMNLFLGGATSIAEAFVKVFIIYFWSVFVGAVFPRFRTDHSVAFFLRWPTAIGVAGVLLTQWRY
jgi:NADH-quinone oxidoreductase subunit H